MAENDKLTKKMTKNCFWYHFFKILCVVPAFWCFYRRVKVVGLKNIPQKGPYFFALTHQNSLMDALAVVSTQMQQPVFVARADIFQKKTVADIFHFLRILPIFRKRDKGKLVDNNEEVYHILTEVLKRKGVTGIMPEGAAKDGRTLLPLQKGIFRVSMKAQEEICVENQNYEVKIVPVGLNWEDTTKFYKNITVVYGKPMNCKDYYALYQEDNAKAFNQMQTELTQRMYDTIDDKHFPAEQRYKGVVCHLSTIILFPFAAVGIIIGGLPLLLAIKLQNITKDPQFRLSVSFVVLLLCRTLIHFSVLAATIVLSIVFLSNPIFIILICFVMLLLLLISEKCMYEFRSRVLDLLK